MKILFAEHNVEETTPGVLQKEGHEVFVPKEDIVDVHEFGRDELLATLKSIKPDVLVVGLKFKIDSEILSGLKAVFTRTTGLDHIDLEKAKELGVEIHSLRGSDLSDIKAVPELTICMMIHLMRFLEKPGYELYGKTLGIIGLGRIGKMVGQLGVGFGMKVISYDKADKPEKLTFLLNNSHVISLHVTADEENRGMINYEHFKAMSLSPFFLNPSRPWLVSDLEQALKEELISGAWVDFPLEFKHPKLVTTDHLGGKTHESAEKTESILVQKIISYGKSSL